MARASYATTPRSLLSNARYRRLSLEASAAFDRLHIACDSWGRFPADPIVIGPRTGYMSLDWPAVLAELEHFVEVYEVDGETFGQIRAFNEHLTARMIANRGESDFPGPDGNETVHGQSPATNRPVTGQSPASHRPVTGQQVADPCAGARPEPEPKPEPEHTPRARPRVAQTVPTPDASEPLPEHAEALVGQLVETLAQRRQAYAPIGVQERTIEAARAVTEKAFGASLRSLARQWPDAWPHVVPQFVAGGPKEPSLHKGYKPADLALLTNLLTNWTPDQTAPRAVNGRPTYAPGPGMEPDPFFEEAYRA